MPRVNNSSGNASLSAPFPAANNFLQKKWNDMAYKKHLEKMRTTKTKLDTTSPKECPHLHLNLKKIQMEEEKQTLIDRDNRILLSKLTNILRSDGTVDNWNYQFEAGPRTLNAPLLQREQERIAKENERFMKKLTSTRSSLNFDKLEDDYLMHEYYKSMKSQETKTRELDARGFEEDLPHYKKPETTSEDVHVNGIDESQDAGDGDKLPPMEETSRKPPPAKRIQRKKATRLPLLGADRRKEEDKQKKEAISKPSPYDPREDASKLFKAIKGMLKVETVVTQTLARRTYAQRQQTFETFTEQYELELEDELRAQLGIGYSKLVSNLLAKRDEYDALCLYQALKGQGSLAETMVEILCTRNNMALKIIKEAYARLYQDFELDIKSEVKGQLKHLFLKLAQGTRKEQTSADSDAAETDAQALMDAGADRWSMTSPNSKLGQLIATASFDHLRAVFLQYEKLSDLKLHQEIQGALSGDYRDAMVALVKCLSNCASFLAEQLHLALTGAGGADESTLIRIMITRSEVDLLQIRREYRKKYGELLIESLETRCRSPIKKALIQMVLVHGSPKEDTKESDMTEYNKQTTFPKVSPHGATTKTLRGPHPDKEATMPADNPLVKSTRWQPKSPVKRGVVVTPKGLIKTPPSRSSSGGKTNTKKTSPASNKATLKSRTAASQQQASKSAASTRKPTVSHNRPTKSPVKSQKIAAAPTQASVKQKPSATVTAAVKQEKPKSTESRTDRAQKSEPTENGQKTEPTAVNAQKSVPTGNTQKSEPTAVTAQKSEPTQLNAQKSGPTENAQSLPERTEKEDTTKNEADKVEEKKEEAASDEGISSEQDTTAKDSESSSGLGASSEDQTTSDETNGSSETEKTGDDATVNKTDSQEMEDDKNDGKTGGDETKEDDDKKEESEQKEESKQDTTKNEAETSGKEGGDNKGEVEKAEEEAPATTAEAGEENTTKNEDGVASTKDEVQS